MNGSGPACVTSRRSAGRACKVIVIIIAEINVAALYEILICVEKDLTYRVHTRQGHLEIS